MAGTDPFLRIDFDESTIVTNMPESYELSADGMTFTFKLRAGMKWSDGEPMGMHDIEFWHTDILQNESLTPSVPGGFAPRRRGAAPRGGGRYDGTVSLQCPAPAVHDAARRLVGRAC